MEMMAKVEEQSVNLTIPELEKILDFVKNNCEKYATFKVVESQFRNGMGKMTTLEAPVDVAGHSGIFKYIITDEPDF